MKNYTIIILILFVSLDTFSAIQGDSFTYQGELLVNDIAVTANYDIVVNIYDAETGGTQQNGQAYNGTAVTNGLFNLNIDLGNAIFSGSERWIELNISPAGTSTYTTLSRQLISNAPYSILSLSTQSVDADGVDSIAIKNASVNTSKIADGAVTNSKLASSSVNSDNIINGTVTTNDIADGSLLASDIDSTSIQQRVSGTCVAGSSIREIMSDGSVTCKIDDSTGSGWGITGNLGTTAGTNFIGTTDSQDLLFKVNNVTAMQIIQGSGSPGLPNVILGSSANTIDFQSSGNVIAGGVNNHIELVFFNAGIGGAFNSSIIGGFDNYISGNQGVILGGTSNRIEQHINDSTISGGENNRMLGFLGSSFIAAGKNNIISSSYSFVGGTNGEVRDLSTFQIDDKHSGTFIWSYTGMQSNAENQFLVEANGGFGIGTDDPLVPLEVIGTGTSSGSVLNSEEVVVSISPKVTTNNVALVLNKQDNTKESALIFSNTNQIEYDIRTNTGSMDFNRYDAAQNKTTMFRFSHAAPRMDVQATIEPWSTNTYDLGGSSFRWRHIYTENITTRTGIVTDSDKRLKDDIVDLDYGLAEVLTLRPVSYHLKQDESKQTHLGFIAQEVESIVPEIVRQTTDKKHMRSMSYSELIPVLIKATQEQQALIDQQSEQIQKLQSLVESFIKNK